jgi:hypothetical protein
MPLPVTDAPQGSQVWPRCYQKCLRLSDANSLITPALITRSKRIREALAAPGRPGVRIIAKQFGVDPGTVQRISRPFDRVGVVVA